MEESEKNVIVWSDDEPCIREVVRYLLEPEGFELHCAATTAETIELVRRLMPDLVITDRFKAERGGNSSGERIAETMKADPQLARIPIILCTASTAGLPDRPLFNDVLPKPFKREECVEMIRRFLND